MNARQMAFACSSIPLPAWASDPPAVLSAGAVPRYSKPRVDTEQAGEHLCGGLLSSRPFSTGTSCYPETLLWGFWLWGADSPPLHPWSAARSWWDAHTSTGLAQNEQSPEMEMVLLPVSQHMARGSVGEERTGLGRFWSREPRGHPC